MSKTLMLALCGAGLVLGGCSLAPEYVRPQAPVPEQLPSGPAYAQVPTQAVAAADLKWREFFADPNLVKVIGQALANNRDLRLAALNVERTRALYGVQRASLYPSINGQGGETRQHRSVDLIEPGQPRTIGQYGLSLGTTSWELDFFGRLRGLSDQAMQEYLATDAARRGTEVSLTSELAQTYLALAADLENLHLAQTTLDTQQAAYDLVKKRYDVGIATELDLKRAQSPVDSARADLARYTRLVAQDRNALDLLAGAPVPEEWLPAGLATVTPPRELAAGLSSLVLLRRPDIMAAEHRLEGAYASIGAARAALFPIISLTATAGTASNQLGNLFDAGRGTWTFVPQFVMPIFDARLWAALRVSKANREIALTTYEKAIQSAFREVADALATRGTIDAQIAAQESLTTAAADTYRLAMRRYTEGIDSYLTVLDAQRGHLAAQQGLVSLRQAKMANQVRLFAVLGGGSD